MKFTNIGQILALDEGKEIEHALKYNPIIGRNDFEGVKIDDSFYFSEFCILEN